MSSVNPVGARVVAQLADFKKKKGSLLLPSTDRSVPQYMTVVSVGFGDKTPDGFPIPIDLSPGDLILVVPYVGIKVPEVEGDLLIVNYSDILAIVEQE